MTSHLQDNAGLDPLEDRRYTGYIAAVNDILLAQPDFEEES